MAFFSFRSAGRKGEADAVLNSTSETVEAMRRRARHRLVGATVLVALGVIGFPLLFDTQPRPVAVDIQIDIPDKNKVAAPSAPVRAEQQAASAGKPTAGADGVSAQSSVNGREELVAAGAAAKAANDQNSQGDQQDSSRPAPDNRAEAGRKPGDQKTAEKAADKFRPAAAPAPDKPDPRAAVREEELRIAKAEEAARARALLQGKSAKDAAKAAEGRFIVQVGAFSESARARETRAKVERAGLKTYTQETKTAGGTWIRVRVGPFATRAEADEAAEKIKGLSLPASILSL